MFGDDADVALVHGPAEAAVCPFTGAARGCATDNAAMLAAGAVGRADSDDLIGAARSLHFAEGTVEAVAELAADAPVRQKELETLYEAPSPRSPSRSMPCAWWEMCTAPPELSQEGPWQPAASASMEKVDDSSRASVDF